MLNKILIVDDDLDILEALQMAFEDNGYETRITAKGEETYKIVNEFKPDVILLDVLLSGHDGRTICKSLKGDDATKHIPIVMISAQPGADKSTRSAGANDFVSKPFNLKDLIERVQKSIN